MHKYKSELEGELLDPKRFLAAIRFSLSDVAVLQQAVSAVAEVVSSQAVEGRCRWLRPLPQCCPLTLN